jgi:short-subunit dehydrogenase
MASTPKPLNEQVIVLTGATSGIGLATARLAAGRGAKLVLAARDGAALDTLAGELRGHGADVATVTADVGNPADVARIGDEAVTRFGRVDTWINDAGISIFGTNEQVALADMHKVMQTNLWGVVNGSLEAVKRMKAGGGGVLINIGSEASDRSVPLQGTYSASKHAVKAFTESLRIELDKEDAPIDVTLIKPAGIDTPFTAHAKNYMAHEPTLPGPVYAPELVATAILAAAEKPQREVFVGGRAKLMSVTSYLMPRSLDRAMRAMIFRQQQSPQPTAPGRKDALHAPDGTHELEQRGNLTPHPSELSPYTQLAMHPAARTLLLGGAALLAGWALTRRPAQRAWRA